MIKDKRIKQFSEIDLYPVISSEFTNGRDVVDVLKAIADGGCKVVQLREKHRSRDDVMHLAETYREITSSYGMLLIINDDVDVAVKSEADGVHLGQDDENLAKAVERAPDLIIGSSTHSLAEAQSAQAANAGYINIGPVFATQTKSLPMQPLGTETLCEIIPHVSIPFTVMGGIKERHLPELIELGATRIAMVTEITMAPDITKRVAHLRSFF